MAPNPFDYITIQNTLARYTIALDTKDFALLKQVFTEDCDTIYPFGGQIQGVQNVADAIQNRYSSNPSCSVQPNQHSNSYERQV